MKIKTQIIYLITTALLLSFMTGFMFCSLMRASKIKTEITKIGKELEKKEEQVDIDYSRGKLDVLERMNYFMW